MSNLLWLTDPQMAPLEAFFPKSHGKSRVDGKPALSRMIFTSRNGWLLLPMARTRRFTAAGSVGAQKASSRG